MSVGSLEPGWALEIIATRHVKKTNKSFLIGRLIIWFKRIKVADVATLNNSILMLLHSLKLNKQYTFTPFQMHSFQSPCLLSCNLHT